MELYLHLAICAQNRYYALLYDRTELPIIGQFWAQTAALLTAKVALVEFVSFTNW
jgi:hypothetical protein